MEWAMRLKVSGLAALLGLIGCGGGGGDHPKTAPSTSNAWLSFDKSRIDLAVMPNQINLVSLTATSTKTFSQTVNVGIVDAQGAFAPDASISANSATSYSVTLRPNALLSPGVHSGQLEVRLCYGNPATNDRPVEGSPWILPYTVDMYDAAAFHFSGWENTVSGSYHGATFTDNYQVTSLGSTLMVVAAGYYSGVTETFASPDLGSNWALLSASGPAPLVKNFALAASPDAVYLSGGRLVGAYGAETGAFSSAVWKFDGKAWTQQNPAAPFAAREQHRMVKVGTALFVLGGSNASGLLGDVWKSLDEGATWVKVGSSLPVNSIGWAVDWKGAILVGGDSNACHLSTDGATWTVHASGNTKFPIWGTQAAVLDGRLYVHNDQATVSTGDLESWQFEPWVGYGAAVPGMAALSGRLIMLHGSGTSVRPIYRSLPK